MRKLLLVGAALLIAPAFTWEHMRRSDNVVDLRVGARDATPEYVKQVIGTWEPLAIPHQGMGLPPLRRTWIYRQLLEGPHAKFQ